MEHNELIDLGAWRGGCTSVSVFLDLHVIDVYLGLYLFMISLVYF